ncbi:class I SAM-dependent methyltransferase [Streptomyces albidochromogenes]|uniref:Class I SAM-dependent methyltransferase n=1 Tax=Streptomyces albidochromogenes TaxID=329524 RepID=A0ABW6FTN3_9ACTN
MDDVLKLLDGLFERDADRWTADAASWWDGFYADRDKAVPFFVAKPDENLVSYIEQGLITPGRALDLGCGPGRNALHLASLGWEVDAVDLSPQAIAWAEERARGAGAEVRAGVRFRCGDAFALAEAGLAERGELADLAEQGGSYDLVYDSGCFHHLPPHRRVSYLALLARVLAPGGHFALTCFAAVDEAGEVGELGEAGEVAKVGMGSEVPDVELYRDSRLHGGLAYTPESLRWILSDLPDLAGAGERGGLREVELRRMRDEPAESASFGEPFLWTALFRREEA